MLFIHKCNILQHSAKHKIDTTTMDHINTGDQRGLTELLVLSRQGEELVVISQEERGIYTASRASLMIQTWSPMKEAMELARE